MKADPKELRERVVAAVEQGEHPRAEVASLFNVSVTFIKKMLRWQRAGQDARPAPGGWPSPLAARAGAGLAVCRSRRVSRCHAERITNGAGGKKGRHGELADAVPSAPTTGTAP